MYLAKKKINSYYSDNIFRSRTTDFKVDNNKRYDLFYPMIIFFNKNVSNLNWD